MHPTAALILWSSAVIAVQYLAYPPLAAFAVLLGVLPGVLRVWLGFVYRARWLLLTLWLILAYNTPGEAYADLVWAPTYEGIAEASLHAARLLVVLGCLSWLLVRLGRDGMLAGLWGALAPARACGLDSERLLVRLALVLERLQEPPEKGAWRRLLHSTPDFASGSAVVRLEYPAWRAVDALPVLLALLLLLGVALT